MSKNRLHCRLAALGILTLALACSSDSFKSSSGAPQSSGSGSKGASKNGGDDDDSASGSKGNSGSSGSSGSRSNTGANGSPGASGGASGGSTSGSTAANGTGSDTAVDSAAGNGSEAIAKVEDAFVEGGTSIFPKCATVGRGTWPLTDAGTNGILSWRQTSISIAELTAKYPTWYQLELGADGSVAVPSDVTLGSIEFSNLVGPGAAGDDSYIALGRDGLWVKKVGYPSAPIGIETGKIAPPTGSIFAKGQNGAAVPPPPTVTVYFCAPT